MSVVVYFVDGEPQKFPLADSAVNRDPVVTVARYDQTKRDLVEVRSFLSTDVTVAEVFDGGTQTQVIAGSAPR